MIATIWLLVFASAAACGWLVWRSVRKWQERKRVEEMRAAEFLAQMTGAAARNAASPAAPAAAPTVAAPIAAVQPAAATLSSPAGDVVQQRLLFDAAHKAGEAGEPALAIQLYARLLARYPATAFAEPARAAVAALKKKLVKV
jgi:TolA-binding protein